MSSLVRTLSVAWKETRQLLRDQITFGLIVGIPALQIVLFGYAINFDVRDLQAVVLDQARTSLSRQIVVVNVAFAIYSTSGTRITVRFFGGWAFLHFWLEKKVMQQAMLVQVMAENL